jgi:hypothetical protein
LFVVTLNLGNPINASQCGTTHWPQTWQTGPVLSRTKPS